MAEADTKPPVRRFASPFDIFRARDAKDYVASGVQYMDPPSPEDMKMGEVLQSEGFSQGGDVRLLYSRPGMSLTYVWFKSGYPLPRHSHSADCLYFIVAGSLKIGVEELGPGDGFFIGVDVPYTYTPGENGVEVLEFRTSDHFDFKSLGATPAWLEKAVESLRENRDNWATETTPSGMKVG
jgi:hypothetical protein